MIHPHDIYSPVEPWTVRITYLANEFTKMGHEVRVVYHLENPHAEPDIDKRRQEFPFKTIPMIRHAGTLLMKTKRMIELASWADVIHFQKCFAYVSIPSIIAELLLVHQYIMIGMTGKRRYFKILALKMTTGITTLIVLRELYLIW